MKLTPHEERVIAVKAGCDPRTVRRMLRGQLVRSTVRSRIEQALRDRSVTRKRAEGS